MKHLVVFVVLAALFGAGKCSEDSKSEEATGIKQDRKRASSGGFYRLGIARHSRTGRAVSGGFYDKWTDFNVPKILYRRDTDEESSSENGGIHRRRRPTKEDVQTQNENEEEVSSDLASGGFYRRRRAIDKGMPGEPSESGGRSASGGFFRKRRSVNAGKNGDLLGPVQQSASGGFYRRRKSTRELEKLKGKEDESDDTPEMGGESASGGFFRKRRFIREVLCKLFKCGKSSSGGFFRRKRFDDGLKSGEPQDRFKRSWYGYSMGRKATGFNIRHTNGVSGGFYRRRRQS